jgi:hypothetical protein
MRAGTTPDPPPAHGARGLPGVPRRPSQWPPGIGPPTSRTRRRGSPSRSGAGRRGRRAAQGQVPRLRRVHPAREKGRPASRSVEPGALLAALAARVGSCGGPAATAPRRLAVTRRLHSASAGALRTGSCAIEAPTAGCCGYNETSGSNGVSETFPRGRGSHRSARARCHEGCSPALRPRSRQDGRPAPPARRPSAQVARTIGSRLDDLVGDGPVSVDARRRRPCWPGSSCSSVLGAPSSSGLPERWSASRSCLSAERGLGCQGRVSGPRVGFRRRLSERLLVNTGARSPTRAGRRHGRAGPSRTNRPGPCRRAARGRAGSRREPRPGTAR